MTVTRKRTARIAGLDRGTAVLALLTCLFFTGGIVVLSRSLVAATLAAASLLLGVALTSSILPHER